MMSKYGAKFERAIDKVFTIKTRARKIALTICGILLAIYLTIFLVILLRSESGIGQIGGALSTFMFAIVMIIAIILYCALNKLRFVLCYNRVVGRSCNIAHYLGKDGKALKKEFKQHRQSKDREWILSTTDYYYDECERLKNEHANNKSDVALENNGKGGFDGWLVQKILVMFAGILVTVCTAGICFPVAYIWVLNWNIKHSLYDGRRLSFDGTVGQLLGKWICWLLLCIPTLCIFALFIPKKLLEWKTAHTHIKGELQFLGGTWSGSGILLVLVNLGCFLFTVCTLWLLKPVAICWKNRFIQKRLIIDGRRMMFDGLAVQILGKWVLWTLLTVVTLGIYSFFRNLRVLRWINSHTHIRDGFAQIKVV